MKRNQIDNLEELLESGFRFAFSLTNDYDEAKDLLQDSCSKIININGSWNKGYLFKTIKNKFIDNYRKSSRYPHDSIDYIEGSGIKNNSFLSDDESFYSLDNDLIERALSELRENEREIFYLFVVEEMTAKQISQITGSPRGTVLSLVHRTRRKLQYLLKDFVMEQ